MSSPGRQESGRELPQTPPRKQSPASSDAEGSPLPWTYNPELKRQSRQTTAIPPTLTNACRIARIMSKKIGNQHYGMLDPEAEGIEKTALRAHQSIAQLKRDYIWLLTPEPTYKPVIDFLGYVTLLGGHLTPGKKYSGFVVKIPPTEVHNAHYDLLEWYRCWSEEPSFDKMTTKERPYVLFALPLLEGLANEGHLTEEKALAILPILYKLCILQRHPE